MKRLLQVLHALLVIAMILALSLVAFNRSDAKILGVLRKDAKTEGSIKVTTRMSYSALVKLAKISLPQAIAKAQKRVPGYRYRGRARSRTPLFDLRSGNHY